jgi:ribonuclease inhibitor
MPLTRIEFVNVASVEDFYDQLEGQLDLETPLGRDPDAVYDILSTEVEGPINVIWHDSGFSRVAMGDWYLRLLDVLNIVTTERADLQLSLD